MLWFCRPFGHLFHSPAWDPPIPMLWQKISATVTFLLGFGESANRFVPGLMGNRAGVGISRRPCSCGAGRCLDSHFRGCISSCWCCFAFWWLVDNWSLHCFLIACVNLISQCLNIALESLGSLSVEILLICKSNSSQEPPAKHWIMSSLVLLFNCFIWVLVS